MVRKVSKKPVRRRTRAERGESSHALPITVKVGVPKEKPLGTRIRAKLVADRSRVKIVIADNTRREERAKQPAKRLPVAPPERGVIARSHVELALLSPFRFPMLREERVIGNVARMAGVLFVFAGAILSLVNLNYATGTFVDIAGVGNEAQVIDGAVNTSTSPGSTTYTTTQDTTPNVRFTVEGTSPLTSMAVVMVTVPEATEVKLVAEHKNGTIIQLGSTFRIDASTWRYYWQTAQYPDGEYRLRAIVRNQHGSYERTDGTWFVLDNIAEVAADVTQTEGTAPLNTTSGTGGDALLTTDSGANAGSSPGTTTATEIEVKSAGLSVLESSPLIGGAPIRVTVRGGAGESVKVHVRNTVSGALYYPGPATLKPGTNEWYLDWNTLLVPNGSYAIQAKVQYTDGTLLESAVASRSVENVVTPVLLSTTTATATQTTPVVGTTATQTTTAFMPTIDIRLGKASSVSGFVDVLVKTSPVLWVELYALPKSALTPRFLGMAQKVSSTEWKYSWQTTQSPNGDYELYARVKTEYGFTEGKRTAVRVQNEIIETFTEEQEKAIETFVDAGDALIRVAEDPDTEESTTAKGDPSYTPPAVVYVEPVEKFIKTVEVPDENAETVETLLTDFRTRLGEKLQDLARAKRNDDTTALESVRADIEALKGEVLRELSSGMEKRELIDRIDAYLREVASELSELTLRNEEILKERIGDAVVKDSDKDGITDYDEVNLYLTNPFSADTDGDSYIDSVEIKLGYNPHDAESEALLTYESPKEAGIVREDLLSVDTVTTLAKTEHEEVAEDAPAEPRALISGKGLPNSFVTLYIYSTPIVLTVKTDSEGNWSYVFDKELEEGEHEVYVGITDNAGRIVAKSNPLPFVKTAVAFSEAEATAVPVESSPEPTLLDERVMLLVASIAIAGLGLVLILLGLHVHARPEPGSLVQTA